MKSRMGTVHRSLRNFIRDFYKGERIKDVTAIQPRRPMCGLLHDLCRGEQKEYRDLATTTSQLTGHTISRFTHVHQNMEDLIKKIKLLRLLGQKTGPVSRDV